MLIGQLCSYFIFCLFKLVYVYVYIRMYQSLLIFGSLDRSHHSLEKTFSQVSSVAISYFIKNATELQRSSWSGDYVFTLRHTAAHCNTPQHTAAHCSTLQHTAAHCSTLQHTATHCNINQISSSYSHTHTKHVNESSQITCEYVMSHM